MNRRFMLMDSFLVLGDFGINADILNIRNRAVRLAVSCLTEHAFSVDA